MSGPLGEWRVLDLTDLRGALCGRLLADLGADVVKVESPNADPVHLTATDYLYRNANKRGAVIDLMTDPGQARLAAFLDWCDVVIENFGVTDRVASGLDVEAIAGRHPHVIHVALADFGLSGPRSTWRLEPLTGLAAAGTLYASGFPDMPPCWMPGHLAHDCASAYGAVGALAAMMDRRRHGRGQLVEVSVQEAALAGTTPWALTIQDYLTVNPFLPADGRRNADGAYWVLPAADGYVRTVIGNSKQWDGFVQLLGQPDLLLGPEWHDRGHRLMNGDVVRIVASDLLTDRTRAELFEEARQVGATLGIMHTPSEYVAHEQTKAREVFVASGFPGLGDAPFVRPPLGLSVTPSSLRRPAPEAGEDCEPGEPRGREATTGRSGLLLGDVRVVEFGMAAVVPEVSLVLSELGADVIKIESTSHPDVLRAAGMGRLNCAFAFNYECRGRRSVAIDLKTDEGRRLAFALCARADVVAENFRGGILEEMGLGYAAVKEVNPTVVYASSQGYGNAGPLAYMPAYGPLNLGFAGLHGLWNHPEAPYPCGTSLNHPDHVASKVLALGVLAALDHRARTGEGQLVTMAQTDAAAFLLGEVYLDGHLQASDWTARGNRHDQAVPHGVLPAEGEDRWLAIAVHDDNAWKRLSEIVGLPPRPEWSSLQGRLADRHTIDDLLAEWTSSRLAEETAALLQDRGVSAMVVMGPQDHLVDEHLAGRGFIVTLQHPEVGSERHPGNPIRFSELPQRTASSSPCLGADTEEVLGQVLGLDPAEVANLVARQVCV